MAWIAREEYTPFGLAGGESFKGGAEGHKG